jgi:phosphoribosylanthranilate isomerase
VRTRIKICGITRAEDARAAAQAGADAIGLVFYPASPRFLSLEWARQLATELPPFVSTVALFVNPAAAEVYTVLERVRPSVLQFHGDEDPVFCAQFGVPYIKACRVRPGVDLLEYLPVPRVGCSTATSRNTAVSGRASTGLWFRPNAPARWFCPAGSRGRT